MFVHQAFAALLMIALPTVLTGQGTTSVAQPPLDAAVRIAGRVELTASAADTAATVQLGAEVRWQLSRLGAERIAARRPHWYPSPLAERALQRWLGRVDPLEVVDLVDRTRHRRDHGSYESYQTELVVVPRAEGEARQMDHLDRVLDRGAQRFGLLVGGSVVGWGLLLLGWLWFDRITRGYMTWRLGFLFVGMGAMLPGIGLLFL